MVLSPHCARPRNAAATRDRILFAARERFARESYDDVGVRDIARDAGVDAALVSRYFGSKEDLFAEALKGGGDAHDWFEGDRAGFGFALAHELVFEPPEMDDCKLESILMMLRSTGSAKAAEIVRKTAHERFYSPFIDWLGGPEAEVRSRLVLGVLMGMALSRDMGGGFGLEEKDAVVLRDHLAAILQHCIDGELAPAPEPA